VTDGLSQERARPGTGRGKERAGRARRGRAWTPAAAAARMGPARAGEERGSGRCHLRSSGCTWERPPATPSGGRCTASWLLTRGGVAGVATGAGGPPARTRDWEVVNATAADALAGLGLVPGDIDLVINTHLHFDHCGQNAVFKHAAFYVQRAELDRCRRESPA